MKAVRIDPNTGRVAEEFDYSKAEMDGKFTQEIIDMCADVDEAEIADIRGKAWDGNAVVDAAEPAQEELLTAPSTPEEKLAATGLTVDDLKTLLGL